MKFVRFDNECCGCGACAAICPRNAIEMLFEDAFFYPKINLEKCVGCGLCEKICSFSNKKELHRPINMYVAKASDGNILANSTSGGMYSLITNYILGNHGIVFAPMFDENMRLNYMKIVDVNERDKSRGSKYVQCNTLPYNEINMTLKNGRTVAVFGTPCYLAGLRSYLTYKRTNIDNLIVIDVVCNGVGSPLAWSSQKQRIEKKYKKKMIDYKFRTKLNGDNGPFEAAFFSDGTSVDISLYEEKYNPWYHARLIVRPSCNKCDFCNIARCSDITIGDYSRKDTNISFDRIGGVSSLLINTNKGMRLFNEIKACMIYQIVGFEDIAQVRLQKCGQENEKSHRFLNDIQSKGLKYAIKRYYGPLKYIESLLYYFIFYILKLKKR